ncbi:hypothetical protein J2D73_12075 [Acetobacter sacchari]|uniref:AsmA-like C-terminal domain-containing protein n=1 Tax=Acetobacter sacchari TaxID=2661687 RepID=A0ABS3LX80_9PROT|nr:hypothetical protein [Acetobacter sacchari]MBO1360527.1 hypothetical protein [Acetobacter sacchari]
MMQPRVLIASSAVLAVVLLGGGGAAWVWAQRVANSRLDAALAQFRTQLPPGSELTYRQAKAMPLGHGARLKDVTLREEGLTFTASKLEALGVVAPDAGTKAPLRFDHLIAYDGRLQAPSLEVMFKRLAVDQLQTPMQDESLEKLTFGHGELSELSIKPVGVQADFAIKAASIDNFGVGRTSRLDVADFVFHGYATPARQITFAHLAVDGQDIASRVNGGLGARLPPHEGDSGLRLDDLKLNGEADGVPGKMQALLSLKRLVEHATTNGPKSNARVTVDHLLIWPSAPHFEILKELGYPSLDASIALNVLVDGRAHTATVKNFDLTAPGAGRLTVSEDLSEMDMPSVLDLGGAGMTGAKVNRLDIGWRDEGLVNRAITRSAVAQGVDPDAYLAALKRSLAPAGAAPDSMGAQLALYLQAPDKGMLRISLAPPQPLPLIAVIAALPMALSSGGSSELVQSMGLMVRAPAGGGKGVKAPDAPMGADGDAADATDEVPPDALSVPSKAAPRP